MGISDPDALIEKHMYLAYMTAKRYARKLPQGLDHDDLVSEGIIGLIKAARTFDPERGFLFSTYAITLIRGAILEAIRNWNFYPRLVWERSAKDGKALPTITSLDVSYSDEPDGEPLANVLPDMGSSVEAQILAIGARDALANAASHLPDRECAVVAMYYSEGLTFKQIADVFGISESRAYQLHKQAIDRLRRNTGLMESLGN